MWRPQRRPSTRRRRPARPRTRRRCPARPPTRSRARPVHGPGAAARPVRRPGAAARPVHGPGAAARPVHGPGAAARPVHGPGAAARPVHGPGAAARPGHRPATGRRPATGPRPGLRRRAGPGRHRGERPSGEHAGETRPPAPAAAGAATNGTQASVQEAPPADFATAALPGAAVVEAATDPTTRTAARGTSVVARSVCGEAEAHGARPRARPAGARPSYSAPGADRAA